MAKRLKRRWTMQVPDVPWHKKECVFKCLYNLDEDCKHDDLSKCGECEMKKPGFPERHCGNCQFLTTYYDEEENKDVDCEADTMTEAEHDRRDEFMQMADEGKCPHWRIKK